MSKTPRWQPIATAPKDGTVVRLRRKFERRIVFDGLGFWGDGEPRVIPAAFDIGPPQRLGPIRGAWIRCDNGLFKVPEPTHWMPADLSPLVNRDESTAACYQPDGFRSRNPCHRGDSSPPRFRHHR